MEGIKDKEHDERVVTVLDGLLYKAAEDDPEGKNMPEYQQSYNKWVNHIMKDVKEGKIAWKGPKLKKKK